MSFADIYLEKQDFKSKIFKKPDKNLRFIAVIPCYNEPFLIKTLNSLNNCAPPKSAVELIIVVNSAENSSDQIKNVNLNTLKEINEWVRIENPFFKTYIIHCPNLPKKHAGAGLARKIGMDEAIYRFNMLNKPNGIIISLPYRQYA